MMRGCTLNAAVLGVLTGIAGCICIFIYLFVPLFTAAADSLYSTVCQGVHIENILFWLFFPENFSVFPFEIQPIITLEGSISYTFLKEGINKVTVQVASGGAIMQDAKVITVKGE